MFVSFTKTLKKISGFRLGFGIRVNKKNWWYWLLLMCFVGMFYLMWYTMIAVGWCLYYLCYALYKIYYYLFKGIAVGCKKLYQLIKGKTVTTAPEITPPEAPVITPVVPPVVPKKEEPAPPEVPFDFLVTKIAGVTFKDGRKSRQTVLRRLYWKDEPFDNNEAEVILKREEFEGKPAFAILVNGDKVGYVPAEHSQFVEDNFDRCDGIRYINAYHGQNDIYGAEISIRFRKV